MRSLALLGLAGLVACVGPHDSADSVDSAETGDSGELVAAPDLAVLVDASGCGDVQMVLGDPGGELLLLFSYNGGLAQAAYESEAGQAGVELELAVEGSLELWRGTSVTNIPCNDALNGDEEVLQSWLAVQGSAIVEVVSDGTTEPWGEYPGTATLELSDVVLSSEGVEDVAIESLSWSAHVGWLPG